MGAAGSTNSQDLSADGADNIEIVTKTENIAGRYTFIDFENGSGEMVLAVICVLLVVATAGFVYIKRKGKQKKKNHQIEMHRLRAVNTPLSVQTLPLPECKIAPDFHVSMFDPQVAKKHLDEIRKQSALFGSRMDLLEARVFRAEI